MKTLIPETDLDIVYIWDQDLEKGENYTTMFIFS